MEKCGYYFFRHAKDVNGERYPCWAFCKGHCEMSERVPHDMFPEQCPYQDKEGNWEQPKED